MWEGQAACIEPNMRLSTLKTIVLHHTCPLFQHMHPGIHVKCCHYVVLLCTLVPNGTTDFWSVVEHIIPLVQPQLRSGTPMFRQGLVVQTRSRLHVTDGQALWRGFRPIGNYSRRKSYQNKQKRVAVSSRVLLSATRQLFTTRIQPLMPTTIGSQTYHLIFLTTKPAVGTSGQTGSRRCSCKGRGYI
jgi:hypothetical protein